MMQSPTENRWGYNCKIVQCLRGKKLDYGHQCAEYATNGCDTFRKLADDYLEDVVDTWANLEIIRNGNVDKWLQENEKKSKCKHCGKPLPISTINSKCYHCESDPFEVQ